VIHFADAENCREFMANLRWPDGKPKCLACGSENVSYLPNAKVYKCFAKPAHDKVKFSLKVATIFEESPIGLEKWLPVTWMLVNCKHGFPPGRFTEQLASHRKRRGSCCSVDGWPCKTISLAANSAVMKQIVGKRLSYAELTGKLEGETPQAVN